MTVAVKLQDAASVLVAVGVSDSFGLQLSPYSDAFDPLPIGLNDAANVFTIGDAAIAIGDSDNELPIRFIEVATLVYGIPGTDSLAPSLTDLGTITRVLDQSDALAVAFTNTNDIVLTMTGTTGDPTGFTHYKVSVTAIFGGPVPAPNPQIVPFGTTEVIFEDVPFGRYTARWELSNSDGSITGSGATFGPFTIGSFAEIAALTTTGDSLAIVLADPTPDIQISEIVVNKGVTDALAGLFTDAMTLLVVPDTVTDTLAVMLDDLGAAFTDIAEIAGTDTFAAVLDDGSVLFAAVIVEVTDTLEAALDDLEDVLVVFDTIAASDALAVALTEATPIFASLMASDVLRVALSESKSLSVVTATPKHGDVIDTALEVLGVPYTVEVL